MFAGFIIAGLVWIVLGLLTIGLACNAVWRAVMPPPGTPREAGCGSCGYELTTLQHGRCSECGADLLKAGVSTRRNTVRIAGSLTAGILGWTILAATAGSIVLYTISMAVMMSNAGGMMGQAYDSNFSFGPTETYDNDLGEFVRAVDFDLVVEIDVAGDWSGPADSGTIVAILEHADQTVEIRFDDASTTGWVMLDATDAEIASGDRFTNNDALDAITAIGLDPSSDDAISQIAAETETIVDSALNNPFNYEYDYLNAISGTQILSQTGGSSYNNVGNPFGTTSAADWIVPIAVVGVSGLVWLIGLIWMIRRRARLVAGPRPVG